MKLVRFRSFNDYDTEILDKGDHYIKAALNEVLVFIRPEKELPIAKPARQAEKVDFKDLKVIKF
jgi:alpha-glucosidase